MNKKYAGLPLWAWGLLGAAAIYLWYRHQSASSSSSPSGPTAQVLDPNAVDPNTGLTYGQEEDAAMGAGGIQAPSLGPSSDTGTGTVNGTDPFESGLSDFETVAQLFAPGGPLAQAFGQPAASQTPAPNAPGLTLSQVQGHFAALFPTAAQELKAAAAKPATGRTLNASAPSVRPQANRQNTAHISAAAVAAKAAAPLAANKTAYNRAYNAAYNKAYDQAWVWKR